MSWLNNLPIFGFNELDQAWHESNIPQEEFIDLHAKKLAQTRFGCTFSMKRWTDRTHQIQLEKGLEFAISDLGLKHIRTDLRWSHIETTPGILDLTRYRPTLEHLFKQDDLKICLNIGPIKTLGWPEEHPPKWLEPEKLPAPYAWIEADSHLAELSYQYLDNLCITLKHEYGNQLDKIQSIQLDNEPFNPMGVKKWRMSEAYLITLHKILFSHFPEKEILLNTAGRLQLRRCLKAIRKIQKIQPDTKTRLGYDHYYANGDLYHIPMMKQFDSFNLGRPWYDWRITKVDRFLRKHTIGFEVTEAQLEPWHIARSPGNSVHDLQFMLLRLWKVLDPLYSQDSPLIVKLWGIERLISYHLKGETNQGQKDIIRFLQSVTG